MTDMEKEFYAKAKQMESAYRNLPDSAPPASRQMADDIADIRRYLRFIYSVLLFSVILSIVSAIVYVVKHG